MLTTVKDSIERSAIFDPTGQYRYSLQRRWLLSTNRAQHKVAFIMLNPSRADAEQDDPTLRACMQFAQVWGYNVLEVVNLFAYCTADPKVLKTVNEPIGVECDRALINAADTAAQIILSWGNWGTLLGRNRAVLQLLNPYASKLFSLSINQSGQPRHPLYIKRTQSPTPWSTPGQQ